MQVVKKSVSFNVDQVTREEVPFLHTFYRSQGLLNKDICDLLDHQFKHQAAMPFYTIKDETTYHLNEQFEAYYEMMRDALRIAFNDEELLYKFFDCWFMRKWGKKFVPYAKATFQRKHPALYGRYDACFDPVTEQLQGIYEFNGDTPVMLFESVNLQARFAEELGTDQYNNWWEIFQHRFGDKYQNVAVACSTDYVEDMATCETIAQAFEEANRTGYVSFLDLKELDFDHMNPSKPWVASGSYRAFDAVYILNPWEEMIENFPAMLNNWERWIDNVHLFEPAWRWFFAHKGMTALCYELVQVNKDFRERHMLARMFLLPTYLKSEVERYPFLKKEHLVEKPVIGRLSNNIRIWQHGELVSDTGGYYSEENTVFQKYTPPHKAHPERGSFILGMWMCGEHSASLCAREFDTEVLSIANERWIPHIVVED